MSIVNFIFKNSLRAWREWLFKRFYLNDLVMNQGLISKLGSFIEIRTTLFSMMCNSKYCLITCIWMVNYTRVSSTDIKLKTKIEGFRDKPKSWKYQVLLVIFKGEIFAWFIFFSTVRGNHKKTLTSCWWLMKSSELWTELEHYNSYSVLTNILVLLMITWLVNRHSLEVVCIFIH